MKIYKSDVLHFITITLICLILGYVASKWDKHIMYGHSPFWTLWILIAFPIGIALRTWFEDK